MHNLPNRPLIASPPWTPEEEASLRAMADEGHRPAAIAKLLGRTEQAVRHRFYKLGIPLKARAQRTWLADLATIAKPSGDFRSWSDIAWGPPVGFQWRMPRDPYIREKFTRERSAARQLAVEYFRRFPKDRYQTEVESWRNLQSQNIEFTMKRLREPISPSDAWNRLEQTVRGSNHASQRS